MVPAFPLSFLARQHALLKAGFEERHPHAWLVWEPAARHGPVHV